MPFRSFSPWSVGCTRPVWIYRRLCNGEGSVSWDSRISSVKQQLLLSRSPYEQRCVWRSPPPPYPSWIEGKVYLLCVDKLDS